MLSFKACMHLLLVATIFAPRRQCHSAGAIGSAASLHPARRFTLEIADLPSHARFCSSVLIGRQSFNSSLGNHTSESKWHLHASAKPLASESRVNAGGAHGCPSPGMICCQRCLGSQRAG